MNGYKNYKIVWHWIKICKSHNKAIKSPQKTTKKHKERNKLIQFSANQTINSLKNLKILESNKK